MEHLLQARLYSYFTHAILTPSPLNRNYGNTYFTNDETVKKHTQKSELSHPVRNDYMWWFSSRVHVLSLYLYVSPEKGCYNTLSPSRTTVQSCYISDRSFQVASNAAGWRRAANAMQSQGLEPGCSSDFVWIMTLVSDALENACKLFYMKCTICFFEMRMVFKFPSVGRKYQELHS